jgi:hypothetical protein
MDIEFGTCSVISLYRAGSLTTVMEEMARMRWTDLAEDMDHWRALVITVMNIRVP